MEKLGKKIYAIPFVICILATCVLSFMLYPMIHMELKGFPMAVMSADEGAQTPMGPVNAGDAIVENVVAMSSNDSFPIVWTEVEDQATLDSAMEQGDYYAALVIPEGFTKSTAPGKTPASLTLIIDHAKTPLVSNLMGPMIAGQLSAMGIPVQIEAIHTADFESEYIESNPVAPTIGQQVIIAALTVMSMITGLIIAVIMKIDRTAKPANRFRTIAQQALYALLIALVAALCALCISRWVVGVAMPLGSLFLISWIASWCIIVLVSGIANIHPALAVLFILCLVAGMMCGVLPPEALPSFWKDWIYPWVPQVFFGEALRATLFAGAGVFSESLLTMLVFPAIGLVLSALSAFIPTHKCISE